MARPKCWTPAKRRRARRKAEAALRERRRIIAASQSRSDTVYAGMVPIAEYVGQTLQLRRRLPGILKMKKGRNAVYTPEDEAMAYLGCQIAGIVRLNHIDRLLPEGALAQALGLPRWMSENTEQRFLKRATEETLAGTDGIGQRLIEDEVLRWTSGPIEVDGDVTSVPQRGEKREGVEAGYCNGRIRPCYQQPRVTVNGLAWWTDLRRGADSCQDLFDRTLETALELARRYPTREVLMRLDGYFVSRENVWKVTDAARGQTNLKFALPFQFRGRENPRWGELQSEARQRWKILNQTTRIRELGRVNPWMKGGQDIRSVAVDRGSKLRKKVAARSRKEGQRKYLIMTNVPHRKWSAREVFRRYHQRQREEFSFKDGKQSLGTAKMPTMKLQANRMHVKIVALAQVILQLFARKFLPHPGSYGPTCKTIREKVVAVGGKNQAGQGRGAQTDLLRLPMAALSTCQTPG